MVANSDLVSSYGNKDLLSMISLAFSSLERDEKSPADKAIIEISRLPGAKDVFLRDSQVLSKFSSNIIHKIYFICLLYEDCDERIKVIKRLVGNIDIEKGIESLRFLYSLTLISKRKGLDDYVFSEDVLKAVRATRFVVRKKVEEYGQRYFYSTCGAVNVSRNPQRIVFCFGYLFPSQKNVMNYFFKNKVETAVKAGFEVYVVFSGEHNSISPYENTYAYNKKFTDFHDEYWAEATGRSPIYISGGVCKNTTKSFLEAISNISPDIVCFPGSHNSPSSGFYSTVLFYSYPVVIFPTQIAQKPLKHFDGAVSHNPAYHEAMSEVHATEKMSYQVRTPFFPTGDGSDYDESHGLPKDSIKVVTPLAKSRLVPVFKRLPNEYLGAIKDLFLTEKSLIWVLVGVDGVDFKEICLRDSFLNYLANEGRFFGIPATKKLRGLFRKSDIFFSIPGMKGGGGGASLAVYEGIPVIAQKQSDSNARALPELTYSDAHQMNECFKNILHDARFRMWAVKAARDNLMDCTSDNIAEEMRIALLSIYKRGVRRLGSFDS